MGPLPVAALATPAAMVGCKLRSSGRLSLTGLLSAVGVKWHTVASERTVPAKQQIIMVVIRF
jgi:hypothetical protein